MPAAKTVSTSAVETSAAKTADTPKTVEVELVGFNGDTTIYVPGGSVNFFNGKATVTSEIAKSLKDAKLVR